MILTVLYRYKKINKKLDVNEIAAETLLNDTLKMVYHSTKSRAT